MTPLQGNDEVIYNVKFLSERMSKPDAGTVEIPAQFLTGSTDRAIVPHDSWADVPMLDLSETECDEAGLAKKMVDAVLDWGFFTFKNHGIPEELIEEMQVEGHNFFALSFGGKNMVGLLEQFYGFTGDYRQYNLGVMLWNESLMMDLQSTQPEDFATKLWPDGGPHMRKKKMDVSKCR